MILGLSSVDSGLTVGLWKLSSLDGRQPPWYRPLVSGHCNWVGLQVWSARSVSAWQPLKLLSRSVLGIHFLAWALINFKHRGVSGENFELQPHSCKDWTEYCQSLFCQLRYKNRISYCRQRKKSKVQLPSECVQAKHGEPRLSVTSNPLSLCGMVWYRTWRVKEQSFHLPVILP